MIYLRITKNFLWSFKEKLSLTQLAKKFNESEKRPEFIKKLLAN